MRRISHSAIKRFENCPASFLYYIILPRMEFSSDKDTALFGRKFHEWAERNFVPEQLDYVVPEDEVDPEDLEDLAISIRERDYFKLPAVNEIEISHKIEPVAEVWGFPDRIAVDIVNHLIYVVDYKTAFEPDIAGDSRQLQMYAYMIYNNAELRSRIADAIISSLPDDPGSEELKTGIRTFLHAPLYEQFRLVLDYVKLDYQYTIDMNQSRFMQFERYLFGVLRRIGDLEREFFKHKNMRKVTHIDGNCNFCMMSGYCIPYRIIRSSYYDTQFDKEITDRWTIIHAIPSNEGSITVPWESYEAGTMVETIERDLCDLHGIDHKAMIEGRIELTTMGLVSELQERQRIAKLNKLRVDVLNRTLLARLEEGDNTVTSYYRKQRNQIVAYPSSDVVKAIVPRLLKDAVKDVRFKDMIDMAKVEKGVCSVMVGLLNANLKKSNVPEDYRDRLDKFKVIRHTQPFLRPLK